MVLKKHQTNRNNVVRKSINDSNTVVFSPEPSHTSNHLNPIHSIAQQQIGALFANETEIHPIPERRLPRTVPPSADRQRWVDDFRIRGPSPAVAQPQKLLIYSVHNLIDNLSHTPANEISMCSQNEGFVCIFDNFFISNCHYFASPPVFLFLFQIVLGNISSWLRSPSRRWLATWVGAVYSGSLTPNPEKHKPEKHNAAAPNPTSWDRSPVSNGAHYFLYGKVNHLAPFCCIRKHFRWFLLGFYFKFDLRVKRIVIVFESLEYVYTNHLSGAFYITVDSRVLPIPKPQEFYKSRVSESCSPTTSSMCSGTTKESRPWQCNIVICSLVLTVNHNVYKLDVPQNYDHF